MTRRPRLSAEEQRMTDAEIIARFMEPKPRYTGVPDVSNGGWWVMQPKNERVPTRLTLDRLHLVEERLSDEQWQAYRLQLTRPVLSASGRYLEGYYRMLWHADAPTRIRALAAVLAGNPEGCQK